MQQQQRISAAAFSSSSSRKQAPIYHQTKTPRSPWKLLFLRVLIDQPTSLQQLRFFFSGAGGGQSSRRIVNMK
eukprot:scaffold4074_cov85-Skeletonema_dohrnii-CCMP3373.AAC.4